jgi:uncharacterized protein (DUF2126 family)
VSIHVALNHLTRYRYDRAVQLGAQLVRLRPAPHSRTRILSYTLKVEPGGHFVNWQQDPQANYLARLVFTEPAEHLSVEVELVAEMSVLNPFDFFLAPYAEKFPFAYEDVERSELAPFLAKAEGLDTRFAAYLKRVPRKQMRTIDFIVAVNQMLATDIGYLIRMEPGVQTPERTLELGSGSCRDSAWLLVQLLRHMGLAARFVSGYLIQLRADQKSLDGPSGPEQDFTDLHAWCEVYLPGAGWIGLDPTSGLLAGEGHIPLACTPEPGSAAPISGALEECEVQFEHHMAVTRLWEAPRVTLPYSDEQWQRIELLGHKVDAALAADDVRLTMGGEPTFVAMDDPDGAEWNTAALGRSKRQLSEELFHRLRDEHAQTGLVHFGQGKWYPGEPLPRWSLNCFWRRDGQPLWSARELIADERAGGTADERSARRFLARLSTRLGLGTRYVFPAHEDIYYYLWRERRLPVNVDPLDSRLADPLERARLRRLFSRGLERVAGHVLPLARNLAGTAWQSSYWFLREARCYLVPGDSPLGYRLPLDSQPWATANDHPYIHTPDPSLAQPPLPDSAALRQQALDAAALATAALAAAPGEVAGATVVAGGPLRVPVAGESAGWLTRAALCAEARNGVLYLFMPPVVRLEDYLELVAHIEATSIALGQPVLLEGYEPPRDARLAQFRVTPDPGVIEVNIHPSSSWEELIERTTHLYEAARETRLITEKFMLDGRHTGTGGGNHFVLGGASTSDSPFLRRPSLLASMVSYWHNHPSLSYLFSGLFIGPTSQAPRVDEARNDALYELEIALRQCHEASDTPAPWLVDRLLRNLLVDVTGNTHRAEFCIDKLFSPDGTAGRLGLLELRGFEMPPHARMSLAQQLLLRALVARFWREPYRPERLARWGTELHDRFMLPYYVERDFKEVIGELRAAGFELEAEWFAPHFSFRFPRLGDYELEGMVLELRHALEPWHVLGEEGAAGGAVRYVDSSLERLQVRITGLAPDRYLLACNGRRVPLRPTGVVGEYVAGVRYRAWQTPSALHPHIGVHAPLRFDLIDSWNGRALGGCQYHVAHPGGLSHSSFPVNAFEAESRRLARFFRFGHTPGVQLPPSESMNPDFPFTLDLRLQN